MRFFPPCEITSLLYRIRTYQQDTDWQTGKILSKKRAQYIRDDLHRYLDHWKDWKWEEAWNHLAELSNFFVYRNTIGQREHKMPAKEFTVLVHKSLEDLQYAIDAELDVRCFLMIDENKRDFLDHDDLFGVPVSKAFPSSKSHIKAAGSCIAVDLNTAAVFHLMLVAEIGIHALAKRLKIRLKRDLEYEDWGTVIKGIKDELNKTSPRSKSGQRKVEFYRKAMDECDFFKDVWRNNIFHGRKPCDEFDANKAFAKVKDFMEQLAANGFREILEIP
jgi:hypothetical protein